MNLTGKQLAEQGIITNIGGDSIQQVGVDLQLIKVERLFGIGLIPKEGKTKLTKYLDIPREELIIGVEEIETDQGTESIPIESTGWKLNPGTYSITFNQGCKVPNNQMLLIRQRSSLARNGSWIHSSVFDPGFQTERIGTVMIITQPIEIEYEARIAQAYTHECNTVENLYDGQYQKDLQR